MVVSPICDKIVECLHDEMLDNFLGDVKRKKNAVHELSSVWRRLNLLMSDSCAVLRIAKKKTIIFGLFATAKREHCVRPKIITTFLVRLVA